MSIVLAAGIVDVSCTTSSSKHLLVSIVLAAGIVDVSCTGSRYWWCQLYFNIHFRPREWYEMRSAFLPALVPFHASETVENRTKNRKSNNYLGYLCEIGWMLSAALYNTQSNVNLVSFFFFSTVFRCLFYVRRSSTHWTIYSGNWLVGVGMVELHTLISLVTNLQRNCRKLTAETWGLLPTSACCWNAIPKSV